MALASVITAVRGKFWPLMVNWIGAARVAAVGVMDVTRAKGAIRWKAVSVMPIRPMAASMPEDVTAAAIAIPFLIESVGVL